MHTIEGTEYLSSLETAKLIGIHPGSLRNWRSDQIEHVPYVKIGATILYRREDVDAFLANRHRHVARA